MPSSPESEQQVQEDEPRVEEGEQRDRADFEDRYKRAVADLENYRKRMAREVERLVEERSEKVTRDWFEAVDSVERALQMDGAGEGETAGLRAVLEQMRSILDRQGIKRIGATGEPFDPARHEAIGVRETGEVPDRTVIEVARSGYANGDRLLRPAQVVVSHRSEPGERLEGVED
jgi:molecular chaperone GrpE